MRKKQTQLPMLTPKQQEDVQLQIFEELNTNPEFSLEPDPTGLLKLDDIKKSFIKHYVQFKSIGTAAELTGIDMDIAKQCFNDYDVQNEIRRINRALYQRQFCNKLISIDDIAGYLTSLLTNENVPIADQLKTNEKLRVVELLLRLNELKASMNDPQNMMSKDITSEIKNLSVKTIQQLLEQNDSIKQKNKLISSIDTGNLTMEEKSYLQSLSLQELLKLIEDINGGKNDNQ